MHQELKIRDGGEIPFCLFVRERALVVMKTRLEIKERKSKRTADMYLDKKEWMNT